jgi:hypothetical protein
MCVQGGSNSFIKQISSAIIFICSVTLNFSLVTVNLFGGVAQLVRACGSYPQCPGFKSLHRHQSLFFCILLRSDKPWLFLKMRFRPCSAILITISAASYKLCQMCARRCTALREGFLPSCPALCPHPSLHTLSIFSSSLLHIFFNMIS